MLNAAPAAAGMAAGAMTWMLADVPTSSTGVGLIERFGAMGLVTVMVFWLMREVLKKLDEQIAISRQDREDTKEMRKEIAELAREQREARIELTRSLAQLASGVSELARAQQDHIQLTREQIELAKRWHDKVDRAWRPGED
jgi:hypothetical protein